MTIHGGRILILTIILPAIVWALECYQCDSFDDTECATRPGQQIEVEECSNDADECVTVIVAGHTRRGCLSRLFPNKSCPPPCERCSKNLCNRNIFPADRLRCYQCLGSECANVANRNDLIAPCPVYHEKDRCFTNIISESTVQRGCERTNPSTTCPNICLKCNFDGCNNEQGVFEDTCFECTHTPGNPNPYCLRDIEDAPLTVGENCAIKAPSTSQHMTTTQLKTCSNKLMYGNKAKCFTHINHATQFIERGCSTRMPFFPTGQTTECYGTNCNNACIPIACSICNATSVHDNAQCRLGQNLRWEDCDDNTFACYACEAPNMLRRGCANSDFVAAESNEACYHCSNDNGCNSRLPLRTCFHCSSRNDESCASATWNSSRIGKQICPSPNELCVSTIVNKFNMDFIVRGCASSVADCREFDPYCAYCNGSLCNDVPIQWKAEETSTPPLEEVAINLNNNHVLIDLISKNSGTTDYRVVGGLKVFSLILTIFTLLF